MTPLSNFKSNASPLNPTGTTTAGGGASPFLDQLQSNLQAGAAKAVINSAIYGTSLEDNLKASLKSALIDTAAAQTANAIGDTFNPDTDLATNFANKVAHAIAGCAAGAAKTDNAAGCSAGALGAAVGEISAELYGAKSDTVQFASMVSAIAAAVTGQDVNVASAAGGECSGEQLLESQPTRANASVRARAVGCCPEGLQQRDCRWCV